MWLWLAGLQEQVQHSWAWQQAAHPMLCPLLPRAGFDGEQEAGCRGEGGGEFSVGFPLPPAVLPGWDPKLARGSR